MFVIVAGVFLVTATEVGARAECVIKLQGSVVARTSL